MSDLPTIIVTGGAGFIGSALCRYLVNERLAKVVNVDKLTYAANTAALESIKNDKLYQFRKLDICDSPPLFELFEEIQPDGIMHLAAESHVDRSIANAAQFIQTNIMGTYNLLETAKAYWEKLTSPKKELFKFLHVSTDEVYGSLGSHGFFTEKSSYSPSSPYSASKASSDHLASAWHHTYGLPVVISNSSNTYGPYQHPEKLIPLMIQNCLHHKALPVYGSGTQIRDWLHVDDHVKALYLIWKKGRTGESYNVGGNNEHQNIEVVHTICELMDKYNPNPPINGHKSLITHVDDRPGHDIRYALDTRKIEEELDWRPVVNFNEGLSNLVLKYLSIHLQDNHSSTP